MSNCKSVTMLGFLGIMLYYKASNPQQPKKIGFGNFGRQADIEKTLENQQKEGWSGN